MRALILAAASLVSDHGGEDGNTSEYDRALIEVVGTMLGIDLSDSYSRTIILTMFRGLA